MDRAKLEAAIKHARQAVPWQYGVVCDAAEKHLATLPKTKMVEVWRVEYASNGIPDVITKTSREGADNWVNGAKNLEYIACIRVTGPHQQEVPT